MEAGCGESYTAMKFKDQPYLIVLVTESDRIQGQPVSLARHRTFE
jgi:hypothetical protein